MRAELVARLRVAGCVFAEEEADLLLSAEGDLELLIRRRIAGEPLEHVLGWVELGGLRITVAPGVFVPRQRTIALVDAAVGLAPRMVLDLCCGCGAVGAVIRERLPGVVLLSVDVDPRAVTCARSNVPRVWEGDLYDALPVDLLGTFDVIVANAPYVPTDQIRLMPPEAREHEARVALDGGTDGVAVHRRIAEGAARWLVPGGHLLIESSIEQAPVTAAAMQEAGFTTTISHDEDVEGTVVSGCGAGPAA